MSFYKKPIFIEALLSLLVLAVLHNIATYEFLYWRVDEFDSLMHFLGGVALSFFFVWLYFFSGLFAPKNRGLGNYIFVSMLGVATLAVLWEIFELLMGISVIDWSRYMSDTTLDYIMDALGGLAACLYAYLKAESAMPVQVPVKKGFVPEKLPV